MLRPDVAAFCDALTGSIQYVVSDPQTRRCAIIDPVLDFVEKSGSTATLNFPGGSADRLWSSIEAIFWLPDETRLLTGHDYQPGAQRPRWERFVTKQKAKDSHVVGKSRLDLVALREARERTLPMPKLIPHALQVNIPGGERPTAEDNGRCYLKIPLDALPGSVWG
jgi:glyoxylase-like metal-dependent hydrolase (beta-lactamase superfamily II)